MNYGGFVVEALKGIPEVAKYQIPGCSDRSYEAEHQRVPLRLVRDHLIEGCPRGVVRMTSIWLVRLIHFTPLRYILKPIRLRALYLG